MKISEIKKALETIEVINFVLPTGKMVPSHFHLTEIGVVNKHFIDCGGTERKENVASFQLWEEQDYEHRLSTAKLLGIIKTGEKVLNLDDELEIEVEYQSDTIGKYGLDFDGMNFLLTSKQTACLASDACGIPMTKKPIMMVDLATGSSGSCAPGSGCC